MKKLMMILFAACFATQFHAGILNAQVVVKIRPEPPVVVKIRPANPHPNWIWIDGHWKWNRRMHQYVWVDGFWTRPNRGRVWVPGYWREEGGGSIWVEGTWK